MKWHLRLLPIYGIAFLMAASLAAAKPAKKDDKGDKAAEPGDYYPLQVGNKWEYRVEVAGNSAKAVSSITKMETLDGKEPLARLEAKVNDNVVATEHLRVTAEGVFRYRNNNQDISPPIRLLKYPAKSGDKWSGDITVGKEKGNYSCEAKEENVEVAAGKFKALKVTVTLESKGQKVATSYWFVKDVGFVKQTVEAGDLNIKMELEKFELAKDAPK
jgi:hypothetical protein